MVRWYTNSFWGQFVPSFEISLHRCVLTLLLGAASLLAAPGTDSKIARVNVALAGLPLHFEANQGQWSSEVRYAARSGSGTVYLTAHGPVLASGGRRVDLNLLHGNPAPRLEGLDRLAMRTNYYVGDRSKWHTGVIEFGRVAYRSVYPGIDVVYYGNRNQLEYDFVLQPGADPRLIQLNFRGADHVTVTHDGDLLVDSAGASFLQKRPVVYQSDSATADRHPVEGRYVWLSRGVVGVRIGNYDPARQLVVDPVLEYSSFVGGGLTDGITAVASDSRGLLYAVGYTNNSDLVFTPGALQVSNNGGNDVIALVFDPTQSGANSLLYLTYLGGSRDDSPTALTLDSSGRMYITGTTASSDFPLAGNSVQTTYKISTTASVFLPEAFVAIINPNAALVYGTYFGGTGGDTPHAIALDAGGNIYVEGTTSSSDFPATGSAYAAALYGPSDTFLFKINTNSTTVLYATYLGGEGSDDGRGLAVSPGGLAYFAASTFSQLFPMTGNSYLTTLPGFENLVIGVIDTTQSGVNSLLYSTYLGGSLADEVRQIALDPSGRLLLTGWTVSPDFPTTANAFLPKAPGSAVAFVTRVKPQSPPSQFLDYSTFLGGSGGDVAYGITADSAGNIYVAGYTLSTDFPITSDAIQQYGGGIDAFLVKLNPSVAGKGALTFGTYFGGTGIHVAAGLALAPNGSVFLGGYTTSNLPISGFAYQGSYGGGYTDAFVLAVTAPANSAVSKTTKNDLHDCIESLIHRGCRR
jgi:beta-propeller repeat-containing protein